MARHLPRLIVIGYTPMRVDIYYNNTKIDILPNSIINNAIAAIVDENKLLNRNYTSSIKYQDRHMIINYVENKYMKRLEKRGKIVIHPKDFTGLYSVIFRRNEIIKKFNNFH